MTTSSSVISYLDRARVIGGLPDVVAIQEGKVGLINLSIFQFN